MTPVHDRVRLDLMMRTTLARLELVSNGTTTSYNHAGGGGNDQPDPLSQQAGKGAPHLYWARQYGPPFMQPTPRSPGATTDQQREQVVADANADYEQLTGRGMADVPRPRGESVEQRNERIVDEGEGYTIKEAAIKFRCGERDIRKARLDSGRDPHLGQAPVGQMPLAERRAKARELKGQGCTVRGIALLLGVTKSTIDRDLAA